MSERVEGGKVGGGEGAARGLREDGPQPEGGEVGPGAAGTTQAQHAAARGQEVNREVEAAVQGEQQVRHLDDALHGVGNRLDFAVHVDDLAEGRENLWGDAINIYFYSLLLIILSVLLLLLQILL